MAAGIAIFRQPPGMLDALPFLVEAVHNKAVRCLSWGVSAAEGETVISSS